MRKKDSTPSAAHEFQYVDSKQETSIEESAAISFNEGYSLLRRGADTAAERSFTYAVALLEKWRSAGDGTYSSHRFAELAIRHGSKLLQFKRYDQAALAFEVAVEEIELNSHSGASVDATSQRARALCMLGLCYRLLLSFDDANVVYRQSIAAWKLAASFTSREDAQLRAMRSLAATMYSYSRSLKLQGERSEARAIFEEAQAIYGRLVKV